jgi:hypothetical protein
MGERYWRYKLKCLVVVLCTHLREFGSILDGVPIILTEALVSTGKYQNSLPREDL